MKITLIYPPNFTVDQPYLALPALTGFLRSKGIDSVQQWDCNIDSFWYFLREEYLKKIVQKIKNEHARLEEVYLKASCKEKEKYGTLCDALIISAPVLKNIEDAKKYFLQEKEDTSMEEYNFYMRIISKAFKIVSAAYYPSEISPWEFTMRYSCQHTKEIIAATSSEENPYLEYFKSETIPRLVDEGPGLVGVSVASMSQIIPSFTLARLIRWLLPETKIVFGGQVFNRLIDHVMQLPKLFEYIDYFIINEGETALLKLIKYLVNEIDIEQVPNLIYFDSQKMKPAKTERTHIEDINSLPAPDFSDLDLSRYLSWNPVLPYQPVRGCYWHKCAFCNHFVVHSERVRSKSAEQFISELKKIKEATGSKYFTMVNESIQPQLLNDYAKAILQKNMDIEWYVGARFEATLEKECLTTLKRSGCKKVYFGLECGSQEVLNTMRKGISLNNVERVLKVCGEQGIAVHLFIMLGFPTETVINLNNSKKVIYKLASLAPNHGFTFYISIYQLKPCTDIFNNPQRYNIQRINKKVSKCDLEYLYDFQVIDRGGEIDYEKERAEIESTLDRHIKTTVYPENIVHYITMYNSFKSKKNNNFDCKNGHNNYKIRLGLGFAALKYYNCNNDINFANNHEQIGFFIYDLMFDEIFIVENVAVWESLQQLKGNFNKRELQEQIQLNLIKTGRIDTSCQLTEKIIASQLVVLTN